VGKTKTLKSPLFGKKLKSGHLKLKIYNKATIPQKLRRCNMVIPDLKYLSKKKI